ncbi:hypothetical protein [Butyrivibrio sp. JL13D10]|uniref:hypothetical protein n=1 Tax=Butyrivibrio sp. JL13D10 TaxID=3236815 RepID=UPI0038B6645D
MNSKNEEYLDGLLQTLKREANSGIAKTSTNAGFAYANDLGEALENSSENDDLKEIGQMLGKLDKGELMDSGMSRVLDSISAPADKTLPKYKIGEDIAEGYEKDADELALDEAIARAEAMEFETSRPSAAEESLLEVAPEIFIEEDSPSDDESINGSDKEMLDEMEQVTSEAEMVSTDSEEANTLDNFEIQSVEQNGGISEELLDLDEMLDGQVNPENAMDDDSEELKAALSENENPSPDEIVDDLQISDVAGKEQNPSDFAQSETEEPAGSDGTAESDGSAESIETAESGEMSLDDIDKMMAELSTMTEDTDDMAVEELPADTASVVEEISEILPENAQQVMENAVSEEMPVTEVNDGGNVTEETSEESPEITSEEGLEDIAAALDMGMAMEESAPVEANMDISPEESAIEMPIEEAMPEEMPVAEGDSDPDAMATEDIDKMMAEMGIDAGEAPAEEAMPEEMPIAVEAMPEEMPAAEDISDPDAMATEDIDKMMAEMGISAEEAPTEEAMPEEMLPTEEAMPEEMPAAEDISDPDAMATEDIDKMMAEMGIDAGEAPAEEAVPEEMLPTEEAMPEEMPIAEETMPEEMPAAEDISDPDAMATEDIDKMMAEMGIDAGEAPAEEAVPEEMPAAEGDSDPDAMVTEDIDKMMAEMGIDAGEAPTEEAVPEEMLPTEEAVPEEMPAAEDISDPDAMATEDIDKMMAEMGIDAGEAPAEEAIPEEMVTAEAPAEEAVTEPGLEDIPVVEDLPEVESMADETPVEEQVAEETSVEEAPAQEQITDGASIEELMAEDLSDGESLTDEAPVEEASTEENSPEELVIDDLSLEDLGEPAVEAAVEESENAESAADIEAAADLEAALDTEPSEGLEVAEDAENAEGLEAAESVEASEGAEVAEGTASEEDLADAFAEFADAMSEGGTEGEAAAEDSDIDFESVSAELDDLLKDSGENLDDVAGEGEDIGSEMDLDSMLEDLGGSDSEAEAGESEPADVEMPDLDAIMNSLASDDVEDVESTAHIDEKEGGGADEISLDDMGLGDEGEAGGEEAPPEDILESMGEEGLDDIGLSDDIPDPDEVNDNGGDYDEIALRLGEEPSEDEEGGKKKKKKRPPFIFLIFAALFKVLTQTDEDLNPKSEEDELASLTDENQKVLDELSAEDGKKAKKEKKKKEKPPKKEKTPKEKKPKPPKKEKPKKEKKPAPDDGEPEKALAPKKVAIAMLFAFSIGVLFSLPAILLPGKIIMGRANSAYEKEDYATAYKLLYGKALNEEQSLMYHKARVMTSAQYYLNAYKNYKSMKMEDEALDILLISMKTKDTIIKEAEEFQVAAEVQSVYSNIESTLSTDYGLSAQDIKDINSIESKAEYTKRIMETTGTIEKIMPENKSEVDIN